MYSLFGLTLLFTVFRKRDVNEPWVFTDLPVGHFSCMPCGHFSLSSGHLSGTEKLLKLVATPSKRLYLDAIFS